MGKVAARKAKRYELLATGLTVAEFMKMPEDNSRIELFRGELWKPPPLTVEHRLVTGTLGFALLRYLSESDAAKFSFSLDYRPIDGEETVLQPDILVLANDYPHAKTEPLPIRYPPLLVVEIVSADSINWDHRIKFEIYQAASVPNYWIVDPRYRMIHAFTLKDGEYVLHSNPIDSGTLKAPPLEELEIKLDEVFGGKRVVSVGR